jgi:hypothetical protein
MGSRKNYFRLRASESMSCISALLYQLSLDFIHGILGLMNSRPCEMLEISFLVVPGSITDSALYQYL